MASFSKNNNGNGTTRRQPTYALRYPFSQFDEGMSFLAIRVVEKRNSQLLGLGASQSELRRNNPTSITRDGLSGLSKDGRKTRIKGNILLPLPVGIQDANSVQWNDGSLNRVEGALASAATGFMGTDLSDPGAAFQRFRDIAGTTFREAGIELGTNQAAQQAVTSFFTSSILGIAGSNVGTQDILSRTTGQVLNPYQELLFKGVTIRKFDYAFKLTPRSRRESQEVKKIIFAFKQAMAAKSNASNDTGGFFIQAPDVFELEFRKGSKKHPFLYSHRTCALTDIQVNYSDSSSENQAAYYDGTPTSLTIQLAFQELDPVYTEDYNEFLDGANLADADLNDGVGY